MDATIVGWKPDRVFHHKRVSASLTAFQHVYVERGFSIYGSIASNQPY